MYKSSSRYFNYSEVLDFLTGLAQAFPDLVELVSIGKSYQKRDLWLCIITQKNTGTHLKKPAVYIDGNHHAAELTGSAVCLYTVEYLVSSYASDPEIKRLLDTRAFYVVPRVSPDGAEACLTTPHMMRSSMRPYPDDDIGDGLVPQDVDGNGQILQMRWEDPAGQWKISECDSRAMARRKAGEVGGRYYRVMTEGTFLGFDGIEFKEARSRWDLDLNRNYPGAWGSAEVQSGSGPFPFSEPETRAVGDFLNNHRNIGLAQSYHTASGVILRPNAVGPDADIPLLDLFALIGIGRRGTEVTGYPCVSFFEDFTTNQRRPSRGTFIDFAYGVLGIGAYSTELWGLRSRAGIPRRDRKRHMYISEDESEEDAIKYLGLVDREFGGVGFYPWKPFNHPQIGLVEIGGLDPKFFRQNPPAQLLEEECRKNTQFSIIMAQCLPELVLMGSHMTKVDSHVFEYEGTLKNIGYLPTSATYQAQTAKAVKPIKVKLKPISGVTLLSGKTYEEIPHLPGWGACAKYGAFGLERRLHFVFRVEEPSRTRKLCDLTVESERAGSVDTEILIR